MFDFDVRSGKNPEADAPQGDRRLGHDYLYPFLPDAGSSHPCEDSVSIELSEPISQIPRRAPLVVAPACTLQDAFRLMAEREASAALVASHGVLLGMLTERDVVRRLLEPETAVGNLPV
ncbi:MAG: CBS domain-containing protein, partial [Deltaproteobacteria bacterium]|nr:CBS domain-containing protein [Deltaproteobacteria bacterium]